MNGERMTAGEFAHLRFSAGFNCHQAAAVYFAVSLRTWARYESGRFPVPGAVLKLLAVLAGDLGEQCPAWAGWSFGRKDGFLYSPEGVKYTPGAVRSLQYLNAMAQSHRAAAVRAHASEDSDTVQAPDRYTAHAAPTATHHRRKKHA